LAEIGEHYPQIFIKEVNHDQDHIHLLVSIPPTVAVGKVVGLIKQNTARELKQKFAFLKQVYWGTDAVVRGTLSVQWESTHKSLNDI